VTARTLARRIVMRTTEREVFEAIRFLECSPEIVAAPAIDLAISIEPFRGRYRILEEGREVGQVLDPRSVINELHPRLFSYSLAERPRSGIVHAALLRRGTRRISIAGSRGAGKTTLALRLVRAGYEMEGDEHVFLEHDGVIARPRACRVKETSVALLPELAEAILSAPVYEDVCGSRIFNVDPALIGGSWRIEKGEVDRVIVLRPNHGGYSSLRHMSSMMVAQALISELGMREIDRGASIGAVAALVSRAECFDLSLGDHDGAVKCIDRILDD
jgi:serine kinase of HPr protein (carbohydrate metabolism regulator)